MWQVPPGSSADVLALRLDAERAGGAFCCPFSSSDEFEAAVISAKRRASIYGPRRLRRHCLMGGLVAGALVITMLMT